MRQRTFARRGGVWALFGAALLLPSSPGRALDCDGEGDQTSLNFCAGRAYSEADRKLNELYRDLKERLKGDPNRLGHFVSAQRAWIGFRDLECEFAVSALHGGSAQPMAKADCLRAQTEQRIEALNAYAHCEEGDISCPIPPRPEPDEAQDKAEQPTP